MRQRVLAHCVRRMTDVLLLTRYERLGASSRVRFLQFLPALGYLLWLGAHGEASFLNGGPGHAALLASTGVVTALPRGTGGTAFRGSAAKAAQGGN